MHLLVGNVTARSASPARDTSEAAREPFQPRPLPAATAPLVRPRDGAVELDRLLGEGSDAWELACRFLTIPPSCKG